MADVQAGADAKAGQNGDGASRTAEKRRSSGESAGDAPTQKKISLNLGPKPAVPSQKISFSFGGVGATQNKLTVGAGAEKISKPAAPIKMSLGSAQKAKDVAPVVQKSALAAKVFDDASDDDDEEEMPPEARMRMKNIGRDTPTASGPNSYGKGKQGFIDRHKIIEKQLKEDMEKVSGDKGAAKE
ncbi:PEST proteolytic signal-containing nuclear protein [Aplysia californica]|uniref:PEST proteolytic signal-containing nuclear protein n=1 Tax=Aplysia californica TaxID=6500 RepID=A0ABM0JCM6_APLCA|nr:PEST proteolytic signal-containing nuclear protein [Aplysia californica]